MSDINKKKTKEEEIIESLGALILFIPSILFSGWVVMLLWGWFIVPLGMPEVGLALALGISVLVSAITPVNYHLMEKEGRSSFYKIVFNLIMNAVLLGFGFIVHLFM